MTDGTGTGEDTPSGRENVVSVDVEAIRSVLEDHPVRLAVLFGSQVDGTADASSDLDLAIEFDPEVSDQAARLLALLTDLSVALDRNDVDLGVVEDLAPRVGHAAFADGVILYGSPERAREWRETFEERVAAESSDRSLRERFDDALAAIDRHVDGEA